MTAASSLQGRRLYLCTPDRPDLAAFLESCIGGGVDIVQLREKGLEARALLQRAAVARAVCRRNGVPFIVNDRPDLALAA
nr:thiamine phosphate synthase [Actinomycetota bacterium]